MTNEELLAVIAQKDAEIEQLHGALDAKITICGADFDDLMSYYLSIGE